MSNPKPVEGALREAALKLIKVVDEAKEFRVHGGDFLGALGELREAALSAAPAPTTLDEMCVCGEPKRNHIGKPLMTGKENCGGFVSATPARDGVRAYQMATAAEVEVATICGHLESGKYRIEVVKALEKRFAAALAAAKEQADGQPMA